MVISHFLAKFLIADSGVGAVPTTFDAGAQNTATAVQNAATTAVSAANAAVSTALDIKAAWSSPSNCLHSKYSTVLR